ncbi:MAG: hypothetical protein K5907_07170 [Treponema sp.]|nr:hypothetical protein [Treponema sp.]
MEIQTEKGLKEALHFLEIADPAQAQLIIGKLYEYELGCEELSYTNRCCTFWLETSARLKTITDSYEKGQLLLSDWKQFQNFLSRDKFIYKPALYSVQTGYFTSALEYYNKQMEGNEKDPVHRAEIYRNAGICYKKLGNFENARVCLSQANDICPNTASVLAELADCYSLCGEDRYGKVLFREAFFLSAEDIDIDFLDSELIKCLIEKTKEKGHTGKAFKQWIPVYGVLCGIFNIKRELTSQEVGRLKQNIYAMESEFKDPSCNRDFLIPNLLNSYFWLIDHYVLTHEGAAKVNEILLKIKILDSSIYEAYIK